MRIGFVGLGRMGGRMARRLLAAGHTLTVHDLDPAATAPLREDGLVHGLAAGAGVEVREP
ncbi:MAG: NAD(P)-binding domain-containing protein [Chloroflexi bacterium]|nr:NAD(P)-binding domain-containing protein [Chloroflexota bacterium]